MVDRDPLGLNPSRAMISFRDGHVGEYNLADPTWSRRRSYEGVTEFEVQCPSCSHRWTAQRGKGWPIVEDGLLMLEFHDGESRGRTRGRTVS